MNYKLIEGSLNDAYNVKKTILTNRGIENWRKYLNLSINDTHDYSLLDNIDKAVECFNEHILNKDHIHIVVDCDVDGYTSGAMVYKYINLIAPDVKITYSLHSGKKHGLSTDIYDEVLNSDCQLLIIPDAGTNDTKQCKELSEKGMDIIVLDHHIKDKENDYAIIVNNQIGEYPNKELCGAGVVYKFLQALDSENWTDCADKFLDLVAIANIADSMDMREFETKYYVTEGLNSIRNKLLKALLDKVEYSTNGIINITSIQFYVSPLINAMIRMGSSSDKDLMFRAFVETDEVFKYQKNKKSEIVDEDIYTRVARLCGNYKQKQRKVVSESVDTITEHIIDKNLNSNKIIFANVTGVLPDTLTGLAAIKIADKCNKPCLLLRSKDNNEVMEEVELNTENRSFFGGSCRNFDNSPILNLNQFLNSLDTFEFVRGHENAAGFLIDRTNVRKAIELSNAKLNDIDFSKCYYVDFDMDFDDFSVGTIKEIDDNRDLFGCGIKEPLLKVNEVVITRNNFRTMGEDKHWAVTFDEGYEFVAFNIKPDDIILKKYKETTDDCLGVINAIGTTSVNNYKGILTPQFKITEYELNY